MKKLSLFLVLFTLSPYFNVAQPSNKWSNVKELENLYRIDLLPQFRSETIEAQISSYDTTGGNDDGFSGRYSYIRKEKNGFVLAELKGPGVINRIWTPTPTTDTLKLFFDNEDIPRISISFSDLFNGSVFPFLTPLCGNELGGNYCYVPIPYSKSCKIVLYSDKVQFHQIQYRSYKKNVPVSSFPKSWNNEEKQVLKKACEVWNLYGSNILNTVYNKDELQVNETTFTLRPGEEKDIFHASQGGRIAGIELSPASVMNGFQKDLLIRAIWDNESSPAIYCPAADFFGFAYGKPSMQALLAGTNKDLAYNYMPMPFNQKATVSLAYVKRQNTSQDSLTVKAKVWFSKNKLNPLLEGKFYALWNRERDVQKGKPYILANKKGKGHYVGTILQAQGQSASMTIFFEGDDSTVVDGEMKLHGTGSEDYFNGGWYAIPNRWDMGYSLPIHGSLEYSIPFSRTGGYRFYINDKVSFNKSILMSIEHGPEKNQYDVDYTSLAFIYSDSPVNSVLYPSDSLRDVFIPNEHFFHRDLTEFIIGENTLVESSHGYLAISTPSEGFIRINLEEIPEGDYDLLVSYSNHDQGAEFSFWQRQKMIGSWLNTYDKSKTPANQNEFLFDVPAGRITINKLFKDVTLKVRKTPTGSRFNYLSLKLRKINY